MNKSLVTICRFLIEERRARQSLPSQRLLHSIVTIGSPGIADREKEKAECGRDCWSWQQPPLDYPRRLRPIPTVSVSIWAPRQVLTSIVAWRPHMRVLVSMRGRRCEAPSSGHPAGATVEKQVGTAVLVRGDAYRLGCGDSAASCSNMKAPVDGLELSFCIGQVP